MPGRALALSETISATIGFETMLSVTKNSDINFGKVKAGQAGTYTISPSGAVTATDGGATLGGSVQAANLTIAGSETQAINISASDYVANNGVTPSAATCTYNGGAASACAIASQAAPGTGKTLLVGVTVTVDGTQDVETSASPSFNVAVTYQ